MKKRDLGTLLPRRLESGVASIGHWYVLSNFLEQSFRRCPPRLADRQRREYAAAPAERSSAMTRLRRRLARAGA
jgi:hypothetical protein